MRVAFYVPSRELVRAVPGSAAEYWAWIPDAVKASPAHLGNGRGPCPWLGPYNWTVQTYLELREHGVASDLTATLPDEGVIIAHGDFLPPDIAASARQFIVEIKPDRPLQCRFANFAITQNVADPIGRWPLSWFVASSALPYWPQPGLIPRDDARGDRFENIGFLGRPQNLLDADLLATGLAARGLNWIVRPVEQFHDYSDLDAIVAVRPHADANRPHAVAFQAANRKPASKLVNAWLAGVPAILSPDEAFRQLRTSPFDFLDAESVPEVLAQVDRLRGNPALRRRMAERGRQRGEAFSRRHVTARWAALIAERLVPAARAWGRSSARRTTFFAARRIGHAVRWRLEHQREVRARTT